MTTETNQEEAKRIWAQLDAEDDGGNTVLEAATPETTQEETTAEQAAAETASVEDSKQEPAPAPDEPVLMREKIAGLEAQLQQALGRLRNAEGHIGGLSSQLKQQLEAAKQVQASGNDAPTAKEIRDAQGSPESMRKLAEDYPEFAAALTPAIEAAVQQKLAAFEQRFQQPSDQMPQFAAELNKTRAELTVEVRHPGWKEEVKRPEFIGWLQGANREVQMLAASDEPADAVRLLDLYKTARSTQTQTRNQRLNTAAALPTGRTSGVRQKSIEDMTPQEYWSYLDKLEKQKG
jgi:hypothetical protein